MSPEDAELLSRLPETRRAVNQIPSLESARARRRAADLVTEALGHDLPPGRLRVSPLGAEWSRDLDVFLEAPVEPERLEGLGWIALGTLAGAGDPFGRWAVTAEGKALAGLDVHVEEVRERDEVETVLARCRRRGRVGLREVLELRLLKRNGAILAGPAPILGAAARAEAALGGDELARWFDGSPEMPPIELAPRLSSRLRARVAGIVKRPVVVAISGVDGAGKSTLADGLATELRAAGFEVDRVWARPGMEMRLTKTLAKTLKRAFRMGSDSAVRKIARGETSAAVRPSSRRGLIGWAWALLVTLSYIARVRGAVRRRRGIVVFDRHLLDALVTLDFVYEGVDLRLQRALTKTLIPKATLTFYLAIAADDAVGRKQSAVFGEYAVRSQLEHYERLRPEIEGLVELDATQDPDALAIEALRTFAARAAGQESTK